MRRAVETGLAKETAPYSHAVVANGLLFTAHLPIAGPPSPAFFRSHTEPTRPGSLREITRLGRLSE